MADSRIKGITIELDGQTTGLQKALSDVTRQSMDIQKELKDVERLLKFDPSNVEAMAQKQKLLATQIEVTGSKLDRLKAAEQQVQEQFNKGEIAETQYRAFRREIEFTESSLNKFKQTLAKVDDAASLKEIKLDLSKIPEESKKAEGAIQELGGELTNLLAGAAAVGGISGVIEKSLDASSLNTKLSISMELDEGSQETVKQAISNIQSYGVDAEAALEGVRRQWALNKDSSDESNAVVVEGAAAIVAAYGDVDFTELIQETNELSKSLDISNEDAMGLVYTLLKTGFPPDQLDIITEYGSQLHNAGYNAQEIQAIMAAGVETGSWNIDVLLDGLKEGRIRMAEFGAVVDDATISLIEGTGISQGQLQEWGKAVAAGGEGGKKAMSDVAAAVAGIEDKTKQNAIGVRIFGTLWEENGTKITDTILGMNYNLMTVEANQNNLNAAANDLNQDPVVAMKQAISDLTTALAPLLLVIAGIVSAIATWVSNNPNLSATIVMIVSAVGILLGICMAIAPIFTAISSAAGILGGSLGAIAAPVAIVVAAIASLVTIGVLLYKNWDEIKAKAIGIWNLIAAFLSEKWAEIKTDAANAWNSMKEYLSSKWGEIKKSAEAIWNSIKEYFVQMGASISNSITATWTSIKAFFVQIWTDIKNNIAEVLEAISSFMQSSWAYIKQIPINACIAIKDTIVGIWQTIKEIFFSAIEAIKTTVTNSFEALKGIVFEKMSSVKETIINVWNEAQKFLEDIDLVTIGKNVIQGLINGIKSMIGEVGKAIRRIADTITDGIRDALDIHSPSRVTTELGIFTGQGFVNGIKTMIGEAARQAKALGAAVTGNLSNDDFTVSGSAASSYGGGNSINQTVNIYSPAALSPAETAKQNKRVLQELALGL